MADERFAEQPFRLGEFTVDPIGGVIARGDDTTQVQPKVMQLLLALAASHGQIVSKAYLLETVWPGVFVVDGALRRCVFLLRKALADDSDHARYLETVPRRGYRLREAPQPLAHTEGVAAVTGTAVAAAYRGLRVFETRDAQIFFGRAAAVTEVTTALTAQIDAGRAFVLLLGPSGCGKSSLARAGVLPRLLVRAQHEDGAAARSLIFQIGDSPADPLRHLARKILDALATRDADKTAVDALAARLRDDEEGAVSEILELLGDAHDGQVRRLVLVFDQFEELFPADTVDEQVRERIVAVLYALARSGKVWVVATMRSEFYPQFMANETLRFLKGYHGQVDLQFPGAVEIADIVRRPAGLAGLEFDNDAHNRGLDQIMIEEAARQSGSLPLLQFALHELEMSTGEGNTLSYARYRELGSLEGCLATHAERTFAELGAPARDALPTVLERLVIADPRNAGRVLKRSAAMDEFDDNDANRELVDAFVDARLAMTFLDKTTNEPSVQFAHEAVLMHWPRARDWVQENYANMRFRGWLSELATRWNDDGRAEHYLLRDGKPLVEATRLAAKANVLPDAAVDFVRASNRRASQRGVTRRAIIAVLAVLSVTAVLLWQSAVISGDKARRATLRAEATTDFLVSMFEGANPGNTGGQTLDARELLERARLKIGDALTDQVEGRAALLRALAETYVLMGEYSVAQALLRDAEAVLPEVEKGNPRLAAQILLEIGALHKDRGDFDSGARYLAQALAQARRAGDEFLIARCLNSRGLLQERERRFDAAAESFAEAITFLSGSDQSARAVVSLRASALNNLGMAQLQQRKLDDAGVAFAQAMALRQSHGLDTTAAQTDVLSNLGSLRRTQGRHAEAVDLYDRAIALRTRLHGADHPKNRIYLANKVTAEIQLRRYPAAQATARQGLAIAANGGANDDTLGALLASKLLMAAWLGAGTVSAAELAAAVDALPVLAEAYGAHNIVLAQLRAAVAATRIDALAHDDVAGRVRECAALGAADAELAPHGERVAVTRERVATYQGGACAGVEPARENVM